MEIYIVTGSSGEYDSWRTWNVVAYLDRDKAIEHAENAERRSKEILSQSESPYDQCCKNEFDPHMQMDYTGAAYDCEKVVIADA